MSKRLIIALTAAAALLWLPAGASAHVLIKDKQKGTGAILHLNPDDDPIAGERASLFYDIRDSSITPNTSQARLTITDELGSVAVVPSELLGTSVSGRYIFPQQGVYQITLVVTQADKPTHQFEHTQRVSRGAVGVMAPRKTYAWAEIGMIFAGLAIVLLAIVACNNRNAINKYSKW